MAFPFEPGIPLKDLIDRLVNEFGLEKRQGEAGPYIFRRMPNGEVQRYYYGEMKPGAILLPSKVRNILRRFNISPGDFGLTDLQDVDPSADD